MFLMLSNVGLLIYIVLLKALEELNLKISYAFMNQINKLIKDVISHTF
jgi:hypothetical protein